MAERSRKNDPEAEAKRLQKEEDGKKAMSEYAAKAEAVLARTERLRALRLAYEAEQAAIAGSRSPRKRAKRAGSSTEAGKMKPRRAGKRSRISTLSAGRSGRSA